MDSTKSPKENKACQVSCEASQLEEAKIDLIKALLEVRKGVSAREVLHRAMPVIQSIILHRDPNV